jgi:hypothetical protein
MSTTIDEGKGLVKVYWADIRHRVAKVEPQFAKIVDKQPSPAVARHPLPQAGEGN